MSYEWCDVRKHAAEYERDTPNLAAAEVGKGRLHFTRSLRLSTSALRDDTSQGELTQPAKALRPGGPLGYEGEHIEPFVAP